QSAGPLAPRHPCWVRPGFGVERWFAPAAGEQDLPDGVVDLVRAVVTQVLTFEITPCPADLLGQALGKIEWRFAPGIVAQIEVKFFPKAGIAARFRVSRLEFGKRRHQGLGDVATPVGTEMAAPVRHPWRQ